MDAEDIAKLVKELKIAQAKNVVLSTDLALLGQQRLEMCLIGKVFSAKGVNRETFRSHMPRILQAKKGISIEMVGDNLFSLDFISIANKKRALLDGPWNFFKELVIFAEPRGLQNPADLSFSEVPLWVQMHNLPISFMQPAILRSLGEKIGKVIEVEEEERGQCAGKFARIRIMKNITDSLLKGLCVRIPNSIEEACIILIYEKLPNFCFGCGRLGHISRNCEDSTIDQNAMDFGNWLRAPMTPVKHRPGNARSRNSDSSVQSDRRAATDTPSDSDNGKCQYILENNPIKSDNSEEESETVHLQLDAYSNHSELLGTSGPLSIKEAFDGDGQGKKIVLVDNTRDTKIITMMAKDKEAMIVEPEIPMKGRKQWKRLARGDMVHRKDHDLEVKNEGGGKRIRESLEQSVEGSKKPKHISGSTSLFIDELAEAVVQPRRPL